MSAVYCEICGSEIRDDVYFIRVNASELKVCKSCARHGTLVRRVRVERVLEEGRKLKSASVASAVSSAVVRRRPRIYDEMERVLEEEAEIPEDFGRLVKSARERLGWKQAELARRINEKQSVIRKIETGEIIPTRELLEKLKRALNLHF
ncbi:MAG: multiprotein bridging factor aMBF1 [Candidatus Methanospirare jalkutatii]|nr:multiprotein bridging factor aMBF1 [Candidatus Methanospirare jalkutatii]MCW7080067.1 multiprotein bridging factor aMBF1 [Candidatus Methanospirare jalkutatii]